MAYHVLQYPVLFGDPARPVGAGATVTVTSAVDDSAAECFSAREGGSSLSNVLPVVDGFFRTYVPAGRYNLTASYQGKTKQLLDVEVGSIAAAPESLLATSDEYWTFFNTFYTGGWESGNQLWSYLTYAETRLTVITTGPNADWSTGYSPASVQIDLSFGEMGGDDGHSFTLNVIGASGTAIYSGNADQFSSHSIDLSLAGVGEIQQIYCDHYGATEGEGYISRIEFFES